MLRTVQLVALLAATASSLKLASYLKPCSRNDPNFDDCTLKHGIEALPELLKGDPTYEVPVLNPLSITELRIQDTEKDSKPTGVDITMRDLKIYGLDTFVLQKARFDLAKKTADIAGHSPHIALVFKYEMDGKISVIPLVGNGDGMINITDVNIFYTLNYTLAKKKDGLEHVVPGDDKLEYKPKSMIWHLENLFSGDKTLGDNINNFLNENWDVLNAELGPYLSQAIASVVKQIIAGVAKLVPYKEVFPEVL